MPYKSPRQSKHEVKTKRSYAGLGLFANSTMKKDDFIIEYHGPLLTNDQADEKLGKYLFEVSDTLTIDGSARENTARYINHSCKPNAEVEIEGKRVFVYAKKGIKPGDEIVYDYGKEYFDDFIKPHGCRCGNHNKKINK